jgi:hypothetical protein
MRRLAVVALVALAGCGGAKVANTPEAKQAETVVQGCLAHDPAPAQVESCIAPPGHSQALLSCATSAAVKNFYSRARLTVALVKCVEAHR